MSFSRQKSAFNSEGMLRRQKFVKNKRAFFIQASVRVHSFIYSVHFLSVNCVQTLPVAKILAGFLITI